MIMNDKQYPSQNTIFKQYFTLRLQVTKQYPPQIKIFNLYPHMIMNNKQYPPQITTAKQYKNKITIGK